MNYKIDMKLPLTLVATIGLLAGCSTVPDRIDILENARAAVDRVEQDPLSDQVAGEELAQAQNRLARAESAYDDRELEDVRHNAYLALRHAEIVEERVDESRIREQIEDSEAERNRVVLEARERDVEMAEMLAESKVLQAERAEAVAAAKAREAERNAVAADIANARATDALAEARALEEELEALKARETERGLVLTLGDVLFDTDRATLKPGAEMTLDRLAAFLNDHPDRELLIEGHTDSRGSDYYNLELSERRAGAVRLALVDRGISPARLEALGLGESYPVATNDTVAGRQQNRRVEIVISDEDGQFPAAAHREIAQR
ncbi:MAG TPA: OmpA family protein [Xanthomonadales bacterium]|nr:OmpA family protein [Xanthomonadales bacterium]